MTLTIKTSCATWSLKHTGHHQSAISTFWLGLTELEPVDFDWEITVNKAIDEPMLWFATKWSYTHVRLCLHPLVPRPPGA